MMTALFNISLLSVCLLIGGCQAQARDPVSGRNEVSAPHSEVTDSIDSRHAASTSVAFWDEHAGGVSERFELAKRSEPELIAFLRRMPKGGDLHNHLGGATYSDFLLDTAKGEAKRFDTRTHAFTEETGPGTLGMAEFLADPALIADFKNQLSLRGWYPNTTNGHDHFFQTFQRIGSADRSWGQMLAEILARNEYQSVYYLELMATTAPPENVLRFRSAFKGLNLDDLEGSFAPFQELITDSNIRRAFKDYTSSWEDQARSILGRDSKVVVRFIPQLDRVGSLEKFFVSAVMFMTAIQADDRIVALNIVAPEDMPASRWQFDAHMKILDFLWRRMGQPDLTLHAGELILEDSPVEAMWDRIRRTIVEGHAKRIGHGTSVAWERDLPGLLELMKQQGVLVEVSFSSSESILGVQGDRHPFQMYRRAGVPICISTDDEGVSRSNLTMEYVKAVRRYDLSYREVKDLARNCLEYAFLPGDSLFVEHNYRQPKELNSDPRSHSKMAEQRRLEEAFRRFEASLSSGYREKISR